MAIRTPSHPGGAGHDHEGLDHGKDRYYGGKGHGRVGKGHGYGHGDKDHDDDCE